MNSNRPYDVIVVGAGPAGSACATILSREGMDVLLVDRSCFPREKICGCCLNPGSWDILENLGVAETILAAPHRKITKVRLTSWKGRMASGSLSNRGTQSLIAIRRGIFDEILLAKAQRSGAAVRLETQVCTVDPGSETVRITARNAAGSEAFSGRYVVGADGRNSIVAASSGFRPTSLRRNRRRVGLQWFTHAHENLGNEILLGLLPFGYFGITNVDERTANIAMVVSPSDTPVAPALLLERLEETVQASPLLRELVHDLTPQSPVLAAAPINPRIIRSRHPRVVLAGDARLTLEPFTGEGISSALRSGVEAASMILTTASRLECAKLRRRRDSWINRMYSPLLRHPQMADAALAVASGSPRLFSLGVRMTVF